MFENLFEKGYLVDLHIRRWSVQAHLDPADLAISQEDLPPEVVLGRKYLLPREEAGKFRRIEMLARSFVKRRSFSFPIGNLYFVPVKMLREVQEELERLKGDYEAALTSLLERYSDLVAEAEPRFRKAAEKIWAGSGKKREKEEFVESFLTRIEAALPSRKGLRRKFEFSYSFVALSLPGENGLVAVNASMSEECRQRAEKQIDKFLQEVVKQLREETYVICTHVAEMIAEGKVVSEGTMRSLKNFIDRYKSLNFVNDQEIGGQLKQLEEKFLATYEAREVREEPQLRENFRRALENLSERASDYTDVSRVTGRLRRQLQL